MPQTLTKVTTSVPWAFIWRKAHSLTGVWLTLFLIIHLVANSQAALFVGDDGNGFIRAANSIKELPYLAAIEILLLALPFAVHMVWGVQYLFTARLNSFPSDGTTPSLTQYPRNHTYTWQRITSWFLLVLIVAHVVQMRFLEAPLYIKKGTESLYLLRIEADAGLPTLSERLGFSLYDQETLEVEKSKWHHFLVPSNPMTLSSVQQQREHQQAEWIKALETFPLQKGQNLIVAKDFGTAELMMVRETFKMPLMSVLYTVLVLSACFHGFNGLWTFFIKWGITLSPHSQNVAKIVTLTLMGLIAFLGLAAIWGTYWINLKQ